jgi:hypothetical protein
VCCFVADGSVDEGQALLQAEVVSVGDGTIGIRLLESPIYCWAGAVCTPADFPVDLLKGGPDCGPCPACDELAVGELGMFLIDQETACVGVEKRVNASAGPTVACLANDGPIPLAFALEHGLREYSACYEAYRDSGYLDCGADGGTGCVSAGMGYGLSVIPLLFFLARFPKGARRLRGGAVVLEVLPGFGGGSRGSRPADHPGERAQARPRPAEVRATPGTGVPTPPGVTRPGMV